MNHWFVTRGGVFQAIEQCTLAEMPQRGCHKEHFGGKGVLVFDFALFAGVGSDSLVNLVLAFFKTLR